MPGYITLTLLAVAILLLCLSKITLRIKADIGTPAQKEVGIIGRVTGRVSFLWAVLRYRAQIERTAGLCIRYGIPGNSKTLRAYESPYRRRKKINDSVEMESKFIEKVKIIKNRKIRFHKIINAAKKSIKMEKLRLKTRAGLGEAKYTALFVGGLGALLRTIPGGNIDIKPEFGECVFELDGECIITVRFGNVIRITAMAAYEMLRGRWNNGASHRKHNAYDNGKYQGND